MKPNELGRIVVKLPLPPGNMSTLFKNDDLFEAVYFQKYPVSVLFVLFLRSNKNEYFQ